MSETKELFIPTPEWVLSNLPKNTSKKDKVKELYNLLEYFEEMAKDPSEATMPKKEAEKMADSFYDAIMQITNGKHYDNFI